MSGNPHSVSIAKSPQVGIERYRTDALTILGLEKHARLDTFEECSLITADARARRLYDFGIWRNL
jgi:hypothetical protein